MTQADINPIFIRDFLGHVDLKTTEIYAKTNTEMKRKALERFNINEPINESEYFARDMKEKYPYIVIDSVYHTIANMRRIKTSEEIEEIKRAIEITRDGIEAIMSVCRPGMNERRLEAEFTYKLLKNGERDVAFKSIIAAGKNAEVSHY